MSSSPSSVVDRPRIVAHYQPQVRRGTHEVVGVEVLARWWDPDAGLLWPSAFDTGDADTASILGLAIDAAAAWRPEVPGLTVAVNVTARDLGTTKLLGDAARLLAEADCPGTSLVLEVDEGELVALPARARDVLGLFRAMGVSVVCDRTGSLGAQSPVVQEPSVVADVVKIDRSLVARLHDDAVRARVARIVASTRGAGCVVAAVGAETADQVAILEDLGCDVVQGFALHRPLRRSQVLEVLTLQGGNAN